MYRNFVPIGLQNQADKLIADLTALSETLTECPYCQHQALYVINISSGYYRCKSCKRSFNRSLNTPFYRLAPLELLPTIAEYRLCGYGYAAISHELDNRSVWTIKNRVQAIEQYMQSHYSELYQWYQPFNNGAKVALPDAVIKQTEALKNWLNELLQATKAVCPHCGSDQGQKIGEKRAQFRCKTCWRYFSNLKGTGLEHLGGSENWFAMIDMLVAGKTNREIQQQLNLSAGTVTKAKRSWLYIIEKRNLLILKEWLLSR